MKGADIFDELELFVFSLFLELHFWTSAYLRLCPSVFAFQYGSYVTRLLSLRSCCSLCPSPVCFFFPFVSDSLRLSIWVKEYTSVSVIQSVYISLFINPFRQEIEKNFFLFCLQGKGRSICLYFLMWRYTTRVTCRYKLGDYCKSIALNVLKYVSNMERLSDVCAFMEEMF